jgi:hypothetical protein
VIVPVAFPQLDLAEMARQCVKTHLKRLRGYPTQAQVDALKAEFLAALTAAEAAGYARGIETAAQVAEKHRLTSTSEWARVLYEMLRNQISALIPTGKPTT